jgi:type I pantothenate kinase
LVQCFWGCPSQTDHSPADSPPDSANAGPPAGAHGPSHGPVHLKAHSTYSRADWANLRANVPLTLDEQDLERLRGTNDPLPLSEVVDIYLPLVRLINLHVAATRQLAVVTDEFVGRPSTPRPYVVAIAGSVAVGKSTIARVLRALLSRWPDHPRVDLVTTDGFLRPTAYLQAAGLMKRKGFPESYDVRSMIDFLAEVRSTGTGTAPRYSHEAYDIVPGAFETVDHPDILLFEGLNVLQIGEGVVNDDESVFTATDFFDLAIYVDAETDDIERWYVDRFLTLQRTAFQLPKSHFHHLAQVPVEEARAFALKLWHGINLPNLVTNIAPTRPRADVIIHKQHDHLVDQIMLRRL